jgi:hypothetical protein
MRRRRKDEGLESVRNAAASRSDRHPIAHRIIRIGTKDKVTGCDLKKSPGLCSAIQTNNVFRDPRGYVYITDRARTGLHILELTGALRGR